MARYEHLPLYAKAMELAVYLQGTVRNFSRYDKYTTGSDLRNLSREIIRLIIEANSQTDKSVKVAELVVACDLMKTTIVFAKDTKAFQAFSQFQHAAALADALCTQSQGWLQSIEKKSQNRQPPEAGFRKMKHAAGFPARLEARYTQAILRSGQPILTIGEIADGRHVKERRALRLYEPILITDAAP